MTTIHRLVVDARCPSRKLAFPTKAKARKFLKQQGHRWQGSHDLYLHDCGYWHTTTRRRT